MNIQPTLILPVESQVREMDAKLLFSCVAAEKGYSVIMGSRAYIHFQIGTMPRGVYVAKSMRAMSATMFDIIRKLGHDIVAWEEEALVHPPPNIFFSLRLSPRTIAQVSRFFAWGPDIAEVLGQYPHLPPGMPIDICGNPRGDMLRPEITPYFDPAVRKLRREYGDFILVNTNFTDVNPFLPGLGLFMPAAEPQAQRQFGQAGRGMPLEFAQGLAAHKQKVLSAFVEMIPALDRDFPKCTIVVRPHPSEDHSIYQEVARQCAHVKVTHEGNVLPWLLASKLLVHNGCTTAAEAFALGVPAVAYLPHIDECYDYEFQGMPNQLSHQCPELDGLQSTISRILAGELGPPGGDERDAIFNHYLAAHSGPLASDRIVEVLDESGYNRSDWPPVAFWPNIQGRLMAGTKAMLTRLYMNRPGPNRKHYHDHRFPEISVASLQSRVDAFSSLLDRFADVRVEAHRRHTFRVRCR